MLEWERSGREGVKKQRGRHKARCILRIVHQFEIMTNTAFEIVDANHHDMSLRSSWLDAAIT